MAVKYIAFNPGDSSTLVAIDKIFDAHGGKVTLEVLTQELRVRRGFAHTQLLNSIQEEKLRQAGFIIYHVIEGIVYKDAPSSTTKTA